MAVSAYQNLTVLRAKCFNCGPCAWRLGVEMGVIGQQQFRDQSLKVGCWQFQRFTIALVLRRICTCKESKANRFGNFDGYIWPFKK
jgi:hypothetical protein